MLRNKKGFMFLVTYLVVGVLLIFVGVFAYKNLWEAKSAERQKGSMIAFYLAESGLDKAIAKLPGNTSNESNMTLTDSGGSAKGEYSYTINTLEATKRWEIDSWGFVPNQAQVRNTRHLRAYVKKGELPMNFWDNAIYTSGSVRLNGNSYDITGTVRYAENLIDNPAIPAEDEPFYINDPSIAPLFQLDFQDLRQVSSDQGNLFTVADLASGKEFPDNFWYTRGDDGVDNDGDEIVDNYEEWVPNVVYVESDLILNGDIGTIGGFFLVVGDVVTDPDEINETIINGCGQIDGCVYSTGQFRVNGGGGDVLNIYGGVWSGSDGARINGSVEIEHNPEYMEAIRRNIDPSTIIQIVSWQEIRE